jgi:hypothetical protein
MKVTLIRLGIRAFDRHELERAARRHMGREVGDIAYVYFRPGSDGREDEFLTELEPQQLADHFAHSRDNTPGLAESDQNPTDPQ